MGCLVERTDTGVEVDIHIFDTRVEAIHYITNSRGYVYVRHESWGHGSMDFFQAPGGMHASLRQRVVDGAHVWRAAFWDSQAGVALH